MLSYKLDAYLPRFTTSTIESMLLDFNSLFLSTCSSLLSKESPQSLPIVTFATPDARNIAARYVRLGTRDLGGIKNGTPIAQNCFVVIQYFIFCDTSLHNRKLLQEGTDNECNNQVICKSHTKEMKGQEEEPHPLSFGNRFVSGLAFGPVVDYEKVEENLRTRGRVSRRFEEQTLFLKSPDTGLWTRNLHIMR